MKNGQKLKKELQLIGHFWGKSLATESRSFINLILSDSGNIFKIMLKYENHNEKGKVCRSQ